MISVINSCGDCGFATGDYADFKAHLKRRWHRLVIKVGMEQALDAYTDARRAFHIFREGGNP